MVRHIEKTHAADEHGLCADMSITGMRERQNLRDVAIIGMSVKVSGANSLQKYWNLLVNGKCVIQEALEDRWAIEAHGTGTPIGDPTLKIHPFNYTLVQIERG